jgi:hypothetical protein
MLVDLKRLEREYYERRPDVSDPNQRVSFGTSGHRGTSLDGTFTEAHILAITQAICDYRRAQGTDGPLYMGKDTHALLRDGVFVDPVQELADFFPPQLLDWDAATPLFPFPEGREVLITCPARQVLGAQVIVHRRLEGGCHRIGSMRGRCVRRWRWSLLRSVARATLKAT